MQNRFPNWLLILISLAVIILCFETVLALFWPHKIVVHQYHEQYHPVLGWANKPNVRGSVHIRRNLSFRRTHNGNGLRSLREIGYQKKPGVKRVLLLGDSFFWGHGVNDEEVISEVLQRKVGGKFEIINGSVTGYGTDQELLWLSGEGIKYQPDVVILGMFPTNDIDEITKSVMYYYPKPFFTLERQRLTVHNIPVPDTRETRRKAFERPDTLFGKMKMFLRHHTHTYPFLASRLNSIPFLRDVFLAAGIREEFTASLPGIPNFVLSPDLVQDLADALLLEIRKKSEEIGARFAMVHIPKREWVPEGPEAETSERLNCEWNDQVSRYLAAFTKKHHIEIIDLIPVMRNHESQGEVLYFRTREDHHWTPRGHEVAAEAILHGLERTRSLSLN